MHSKLLHAFTGLLTVMCVTRGLAAQKTSRSEFIKLLTEKDKSVTGVVQKESDKEITVLELKSRKSTTFQKKSLKSLLRKLTDKQAVSIVGLCPVVSWRVKEVFPAKKATGRIASINLSSIYVTLARKHGVRVGDKLAVIRGKTVIKDPKTGKVLGTERRLVARLQISEVNEKYSKATLTGDLEIELKPGDVVEIEASKSVAVLPLVDENGLVGSAGVGLSEEITSWLVKDGLAVVERKQLANVRQELAQQQGKDFDAKTAQKLGKQIGAYAILTGSVVSKKNKSQVSIRLIEMRTGKVLFAASFLTDPLKNVSTTSRFNRHRYWVSDKKMTWPEAEAFCKKLGGHLVCIESQIEQKFLENLVQKSPAKGQAVWIGLRKQENGLTWVNGNKPRYFAWDYVGPGGRRELRTHLKKFTYIVMWGNANKWRFKDSPKFHFHFICEWDK